MRYLGRTCIRIISITLACFAIGSLIATVWLVVSVSSERSLLKVVLAEKAQANVRDNYSASVRALARDTIRGREELSAIISQNDVVGIIEVLENAGNDAGVAAIVDVVSPGDKVKAKVININIPKFKR